MVEHEEKNPAWFRVFYCRTITVEINGILCDSMMSRMKKNTCYPLKLLQN
jgi:hypothetical protein